MQHLFIMSKRSRSSRVLKKPAMQYTPTFPSISVNAPKPKLTQPTIENETIEHFLKSCDKNKTNLTTIIFTVNQIYTNSMRMYCSVTNETFYSLFGCYMEDFELLTEKCFNGFFPLKKTKENNFNLVIKFMSLNQIEILKDENEQYGYKTNIDVQGDVTLFPYYNYPEEQNYGLCVKLKAALSFVENE